MEYLSAIEKYRNRKINNNRLNLKIMKKIILFTVAILLQTTFAIGQTCVVCDQPATGVDASIIGKYSTAAGAGSVAIGSNSHTLETALNSIAIGTQVKTVAGLSVVIGSGANSQNMLVNSNQQTLMVGFGSSKPTFFVGRSSAYNKTGRIGIGNITNPQAKLHIKADDSEEAAVFIEPYTWSGGAQAYLRLGNSSHGITADYRGGLVFCTQVAYLFNDGNVGIGTGEENLPEEKLDVVGTVKMTGLRLLNQSAQAGRVLTCSGFNGQAVWQNPEEFSIWSENEDGSIYRMSRVGIKTQFPQTELDINGNISVNDAIIGKITKSDWVDPDFLTILGSVNANASKIMIPKGNNPEHLSLKIINKALNGDIQFFAGGNYNAVLRSDEFIVGFKNREVDLKVNGKIWSHEVEVQLTDWWDEVFDKSYKLMPLHQLESYIETNHHLPDIPTENDVLENGIELGEMNALLLKKIEELTLYIIKQEKRITALESINSNNK